MAIVQTVDFFRSFIDDPYVFGKIAANHALSDCHAMCAEARTALAIAVVPFAIEAKVEETLFQMMAGACEMLKESDCALVGGHTCEGLYCCGLTGKHVKLAIPRRRDAALSGPA